MPVRNATLSDLSTISQLFSQAWYDEALNHYIFPNRAQYPSAYLRAWHEKVLERFWNYSCVMLVSYSEDDDDDNKDNKNTIEATNSSNESNAGPAPLKPSAPHHPGQTIKAASIWTLRHNTIPTPWGISRYNPLRLISPFLSFLQRLRNTLWRNPASRTPSQANPSPLDKFNFVERLGPFVAKYLSRPPHCINHWELSYLGVGPAFQGQGVGSELVQWGLDRAEREGLPAVVVAAPEKENYYRKRGFTEFVAMASEVEEDGEGKGRVNPLLGTPVGGGAIMWTR